LLISLLFTLIAIPLGQVTGFKLQVSSANLVISAWLPLLAENLLASQLALLGGWRPALIYRAMLAAFWWFCPILPNLSWSLLGLIGTMVPVAGMITINSIFAGEMNHGKARIRREEGFSMAKWVAAAMVSVLFIWFAVGIFPIKPSVIVSGSMIPRMNVGDIALVAKVAPSSIKVGDVIEFRRSAQTTVLHRVIAILEVGGRRAFETRGDANNAADADLVAAENVVGRLIGVVPKVGWVSISIKNLFSGRAE
jgi:signal peptidase